MKKKINSYLILGIVSYMIAMGAMLSGTKKIAKFLEIPMRYSTILKVIGIIMLVVTIILITAGVIKYAGTKEEWQIEENDERNIMIRGKSAELSSTISAFIYTGITIIFVALEYTVPSLIMAGSLFINSTISLWSHVYYEKKY